MSKFVLVIDDEEGVRNSFVLALEDTGYLVDTVSNGFDAIRLVNRKRYHLIYLDLYMPVINGIDTLRELREIDKNVPVYIVTAFHKEFLNQLDGLTNDAIEFNLVSKPIGMRQIIMATKAVLDGPVSVTV